MLDNNIIYKYRAFDKEEHSLDILRKGELWFADPKTFNDPFDCRIEYKALSKEEKKEYIDNLQQKRKTKYYIDDNTIEETIDAIIYCPVPFRVLSLTNNELNILMWSHYADNHKGFCIGFKTYNHMNAENEDLFMKIEKDQIKDENLLKFGIDDTFIPLVPIIYNDNMPKERDLNNRDDDVYRFFIQKASLWKYEGEYRAFLWKNTILDKRYKPVKINKNEISEIIFGLKTDYKEKKKVVDIVSNYERKPKLYQCEYVKGKYAISKKELSYSDI